MRQAIIEGEIMVKPGGHGVQGGWEKPNHLLIFFISTLRTRLILGSLDCITIYVVTGTWAYILSPHFLGLSSDISYTQNSSFFF